MELINKEVLELIDKETFEFYFGDQIGNSGYDTKVDINTISMTCGLTHQEMNDMGAEITQCETLPNARCELSEFHMSEIHQFSSTQYFMQMKIMECPRGNLTEFMNEVIRGIRGIMIMLGHHIRSCNIREAYDMIFLFKHIGTLIGKLTGIIRDANASASMVYLINNVKTRLVHMYDTKYDRILRELCESPSIPHLSQILIILSLLIVSDDILGVEYQSVELISSS